MLFPLIYLKFDHSVIFLAGGCPHLNPLAKGWIKRNDKYAISAYIPLSLATSASGGASQDFRDEKPPVAGDV